MPTRRPLQRHKIAAIPGGGGQGSRSGAVALGGAQLAALGGGAAPITAVSSASINAW
jgi:hypothetical protein